MSGTTEMTLKLQRNDATFVLKNLLYDFPLLKLFGLPNIAKLNVKNFSAFFKTSPTPIEYGQKVTFVE